MKKYITGIFIFAAFTSSCKSRDSASKQNGVGEFDAHITPVKSDSTQFGIETPLGRKVYEYSQGWVKEQARGAAKAEFAQAARCAYNVSEVLEEVFGSRYNAQAVVDMKRKLGRSKVTFNGDNSSGMADKLNRLNSYAGGTPAASTGFIPVGTVVAGCNTPECDKFGPNEHVGIVGRAEVRADGHVIYWLAHNNWLRRNLDRSRDLGRGLGNLGKYTLPSNYEDLGFERKWMETPWLDVKYNSAGKAISVSNIIFELDDMNPSNGEYHVSLLVPEEIANQVDSGAAKLLNISTEITPESSEPKTCTVIEDNLNVRLTPNGDILGKVPKGQQFLRTASEDRWLKVQIRIDGKLFGAGGDGSPTAYVFATAVNCD